MATQAWPYAVTRGEKSGYQAIVVPGFLADTGQAYVLEYASRESGEPNAVTVREILGATPKPLSLAYRVMEARADRYGVGGDDLLEDRAGRTIRVFEGLVLQLPAERVASLGLTVEDLEAVTGVTAPAFRKLWAAEARIDAEPSTAIRVGGDASGARLMNLQIVEPYVMPGSDLRRGTRDPEDVRARTRGALKDDREYIPVKRSAGGRSPVPREAHPKRTRLITAVAIICGLVLLGWLLARPLSPSTPPHPPPPSTTLRTTVQQLCNDLKSGDASAAYQQFSNSYQHSTTLDAFHSRLLGPSSSGICTSMTTTANEATLSLRLAAGTTNAVHLDLQPESGRWRITTMKVSP